MVAGVDQLALLEAGEGGAPSRRTTARWIGVGDIVEVDKRGRRFHALVVDLDQRESNRYELTLRPLDPRVSWRTATVRDVTAVWRRAPG
jgi:hypothetical protein